MLAGGGLFCDTPHLLSREGSLLFVCCVDSVVAYSTGTGEQAFTLQHAAAATALSLHPTDDSRLYSGSKDGLVTLWDLPTGTEVQRWRVESPVESLVVAEDAAYVSCHWRQQQAGRLFAYDLAKGAAASGRAKVSAARQLVASSCGQVLATVDRHTAMIWQADRFPHSPLVLTHTKPLTCAALSGSGDILAVGDATGRIVFWHGVRDALQRRPQHDGSGSAAAAGAADAAGEAMQPHPQPDPAEGPKLSQATVHWHAEAVCCLAFSPDDAYLLSGGHEGVLVVWDISSGRRTYLPRLGSCLRSIAPCSGDPSQVAVSLSDNVVRMVDLATMHVRCSVRGISCAPAAPVAARMVAQPVTGHLALASSAATLQFYDPLGNAHVDRLRLSDAGGARAAQGVASKLPPPTHTLFSADAEVLVTVEQHLGVAGGAVSVVKAWRRSQLQSYGRSYTLAPGEGNPLSIQDSVTSAALHPHRPLVAIALGCGGIRLLELDGRPRSAGWVMTCPRDLEGTAVGALAFSPDGSVLALGTTTSHPVLLVDPESQQILAALPPALEGCEQQPAALQRLAFLADGLHLVVQWDGGVAAYSLLSGRLTWACQLPTTLLAVDSRSARCAVGTPSGALVFLDAGGSVGEGAGLLHGSRMQAAEFLTLQDAQGQATSAAVVLNDAHQFAACLPAPPPRAVANRLAAGGSSLQQGAKGAKAAAAGGSTPRPRPRQVDAFFAANCTQSASHLLASPAELCPLSLEPLLLW